MPSYVRNPHSSLIGLALTCAGALVLTACDRVSTPGKASGGDITEMQWARIALERNPQIEVVATDAQAQVFTIRNKATGDVQAVKLSELAAAPTAYLNAPRAAAKTDKARPDTDSAATATPAADSAKAAEEDTAAESSAATAPTSTTSPAVAPQNYTIERADGKVKVSGPGVSIESSGAGANAAAQAALEQKKSDPIICEGRRMIQLDNRILFVDGDAVTARGGCEIYITNSRIVATGTGVVVRDAVVHIYNSYVEGSGGSIEVDSDAKLYVRGSTFHGLSRRDSLASIQDQGGNQWR